MPVDLWTSFPAVWLLVCVFTLHVMNVPLILSEAKITCLVFPMTDSSPVSHVLKIYILD